MKFCLPRTALLAACLFGTSAHSQTPVYPVKPVRFILPTGAGGSLDTMARLLGQRLTETWSQQVIIENRPGGGGMLGAGTVAKAPADGYTLLVASNGNISTTQALYKNVPYDPVKDFAPITLIATNPYVLVAHPSLPAKNMHELVRLAKAKPGAVNVSSSGNGSTPHLALELLNLMADIKLTHIPHKTSSGALVGVVSGETSLMFTGIVSGLPYVNNGKLRALAVASKNRVSVLPRTPTIAEDGVPGYEASNWAGLLAPVQTPAAINRIILQDTLKILQTPDIRDALQKQGLEVVGSTPEEFGTLIKHEIEKWTVVIRKSGAKID